MAELKNRQWLLAARPSGMIKEARISEVSIFNPLPVFGRQFSRNQFSVETELISQPNEIHLGVDHGRVDAAMTEDICDLFQSTAGAKQSRCGGAAPCRREKREVDVGNGARRVAAREGRVVARRLAHVIAHAPAPDAA